MEKVKSVLRVPALAGSTTVELVEKVGWKNGEVVAIASTDFDGTHAEQRILTNIRNTSTYTLFDITEPLEFDHDSYEETLSDGSKVPIRGEVGLLSRSIVIQGDENSAS